VLTERLGRIRDHVYVVLVSGVVEQETDEWCYLEVIPREVHGERVYRRMRGRGYGRQGLILWCCNLWII
jgi:hypothetical protein